MKKVFGVFGVLVIFLTDSALAMLGSDASLRLGNKARLSNVQAEAEKLKQWKDVKFVQKQKEIFNNDIDRFKDPLASNNKESILVPTIASNIKLEDQYKAKPPLIPDTVSIFNVASTSCSDNSKNLDNMDVDASENDLISFQVLQALQEQFDTGKHLMSIIESDNSLNLSVSIPDQIKSWNIEVSLSEIVNSDITGKHKPLIHNNVPGHRKFKRKMSITNKQFKREPSPLIKECIPGDNLVSLDAALEVKKNRPMTLIDAVYQGNVSVMEELYMRGANINQRTVDGMTPLYLAVKLDQLNVVMWLILHGASVELTATKGFNALHLAALYGNLEIVEAIGCEFRNLNVKTELGMTPLWLAAYNGHVDVVKWLIQHKARVNCLTGNRFSPLHAAAQTGHLEVIQCLESFGANVYLSTVDGDTCLHLAVYNGWFHVIKHLVMYPKLIYAINNKCLTPLGVSKSMQYKEITEFLEKVEAINSLNVVK